MRPDIKICGLKSPEAVDHALKRGASHIGFIFFPKSPRFVEPDLAGQLAERARGRAKSVAVTVDPTNDDLDEIVALMKPDIIQLHGRETADRVLAIKSVYNLPVMKAFSIRDADDLKRAEACIGLADKLLFDAKAPAGSELPGGNGVSFDWRLLASLDAGVDYMLSGGLTKDNIAEALAVTGARGIDVSSGVESEPGIKSIAMMDAFFDAVEAASGSRE